MTALVYNPTSSSRRPLPTSFSPLIIHTTSATTFIPSSPSSSFSTRPISIPVPALPPIPRRRRRRVAQCITDITTTITSSTPTSISNANSTGTNTVDGKTTIASKSFYLSFPSQQQKFTAPILSSSKKQSGSKKSSKLSNTSGFSGESSPVEGIGGKCPCDLCEDVDVGEHDVEMDATNGVTVTIRSVSIDKSSPGRRVSSSSSSTLPPIYNNRAAVAATAASSSYSRVPPTLPLPPPVNADFPSSGQKNSAQTNNLNDNSEFSSSSVFPSRSPRSRSPREEDLLAPGKWESINVSRRGSHKTLLTDPHQSTPSSSPSPNHKSALASTAQTKFTSPRIATTTPSSRSLFKYEPTPSLSPSTPFLPLFRRRQSFSPSRSRSRTRHVHNQTNATISSTGRPSASQSRSPSSGRRPSKANSLTLDLSLSFEDGADGEENIIPRPGAELLAFLLQPPKGCWSPDFEEVGEVVDSGVWAWEDGQVVISQPLAQSAIFNPHIEHDENAAMILSSNHVKLCPRQPVKSHPLDSRNPPLALPLPFPRRDPAPSIPEQTLPSCSLNTNDDYIASSVCMLRFDVQPQNLRVHPTSPLAEGVGRSAEQRIPTGSSSSASTRWNRSNTKWRGLSAQKMENGEGEAMVKASRKAQDVEALRIQVLEWAMVRSGKLSAVRVRA